LVRTDLIAATATTRLTEVPTASAGATFPSAGELGREAARAVERFAFPLILMAFVVGFVLIQNRVDSKDAKFTLAAADSDSDLLSFR
jgi:hypothetical protein